MHQNLVIRVYPTQLAVHSTDTLKPRHPEKLTRMSKYFDPPSRSQLEKKPRSRRNESKGLKAQKSRLQWSILIRGPHLQVVATAVGRFLHTVCLMEERESDDTCLMNDETNLPSMRRRRVETRTCPASMLEVDTRRTAERHSTPFLLLANYD